MYKKALADHYKVCYLSLTSSWCGNDGAGMFCNPLLVNVSNNDVKPIEANKFLKSTALYFSRFNNYLTTGLKSCQYILFLCCVQKVLIRYQLIDFVLCSKKAPIWTPYLNFVYTKITKAG